MSLFAKYEAPPESTGARVWAYAIYALIDPRDQTARYVGVTRNPKVRLAAHVAAKTVNAGLRGWVLSLRKQNHDPIMEIIEMVPRWSWEKAERRWIAHFRARGRLYNIEDGGIVPRASDPKRTKRRRKGASFTPPQSCTPEQWRLRKQADRAAAISKKQIARFRAERAA